MRYRKVSRLSQTRCEWGFVVCAVASAAKNNAVSDLNSKSIIISYFYGVICTDLGKFAAALTSVTTSARIEIEPLRLQNATKPVPICFL